MKLQKKIVQALDWTGILMIEFKGITEEDAYFMEVNGRPWGSMDLAISSGVEFPRMMLDLFVHNLSYQKLQKNYQQDYELDAYSKWIVGELNFIRYLLKESLPFKQKMKLLIEVLFHKPKKVTYDTFHANDPLPFFMEFLTILKSGLMKALLKLKTKLMLSLKKIKKRQQT
ncbi:ATP-grasp domain-containing protein [Bacillus taeanensis]|uniref:ATP-grasp domain-containing protein n=1 Tax=Bacillus taeanensis TaxID=273032 RepID=A0A366XX92_9BACI|nr:ATP-grasp domain-containing protein [Bacillus taeanensis]RBW70188.1 hypothetical protein DS031_08350 [Bacillus taeanensis]